MRLFLAVAPDEPAAGLLSRRFQEIGEQLRALGHDLRWSDADHAHLTLHFLGEIDAARVDPLQAALEGPLDQPVFSLAFGRAGVFPPSGHVRVIWLGVEQGAAELTGLHTAFGHRLAAFGLAPEARPFSPHLTVARVRRGAHTGRARDLRRLLDDLQTTPIQSRVDRVTLFRSELGAARPRYTVLREFPLDREEER